MATKSYRSRKPLLLVTCLAVSTIAGFLAYQLVIYPAMLRARLPDPDLSQVEPQVAEKISKLSRLVEENPKSAEKWGKLAMTFDAHEFKREATECYEKAHGLDPDEFRWAYFYTILCSEAGSKDALEWFERCMALRSDYVPLQVLYGRALYDAGYRPEAENAFRAVLAQDSTNPHAYLGLARIALRNGKLDESEKFLERTVELDEKYGEAYGLLAEVYRRRDEEDNAREAIFKANALPKFTPLVDPVYEDVVSEGVSAFWYRNRGLVYQEKGQIDKAITEFETALQLRPDPSGYKFVGDLLFQSGRFSEAATRFQIALSMAPYQLEAYLSLGQTLAQLDRMEEAQICVEKALRINPRFAEAYRVLSDFYVSQDQDAAAITVLRRGLRIDPGHAGLALHLAWILATSPHGDIRDGNEALILATTACSQLPQQSATSLDVLAAAYAETGRFDKASETVQRAHELAIAAAQDELAIDIETRLRSYQANRPFHR